MAGKRCLLVLLVVLLQISDSGQSLLYASTYQDNIQNFEKLAKEACLKSKTQGASVVTVKGKTDSFLNMGETDKSAVSKDTLFELGSVSKSFTALAVYYMENQGFLKLDTDIQQYIKEISFDYSKICKDSMDEEPVTVKDLLCHTSGIPWISTVHLPEGDSEDMLEKTVVGNGPIVLESMPGDKYCYASLNYDILGLLIQRISGMSYEEYMEQVIFKMLGMSHTYVYNVPAGEVSKLSPGYEFLFCQTKEWQPPHYRGNEPAGYIISCTNDMLRWMKILLGQVTVSKDLKEAVEQEFSFDYSGEVTDDIQYSSGWFFHTKEERYDHGGSNPGFSSMISVDREEGVGICILTNQNSNLPSYLADSFFLILSGEKTDRLHVGGMRLCDMVCSSVLILVNILSIRALILAGCMVSDIVRKKRRFGWNMKKKSIVLTIILYCIAGFIVFGIMDRDMWRALYVWLPKTLTYFIEAGFMCILIMTGSGFIRTNFPRLQIEDKKEG